jgi:exopolyphosphatase/guanosine-5'-triphosphate,3'-diphosphate pyrophosphatase
VRFHRKGIKLEELPRLNLFKKKHYLPLIQLLRLSTLLNNQRQSTTTPETLRLSTDDNHWTLRFPAGYLALNNLVQLDLEREQAYWNDVVGWKLICEEEDTQNEQRSA